MPHRDLSEAAAASVREEACFPRSSCLKSCLQFSLSVSSPKLEVSATLRYLPFPGGSDGKESACNAEDQGLISGLGRSLGEGNCYPLQYSCLENPHGQRNLSVNKESETNKQLALTVTKFLPLSPEPVLLHLTSCCQGWSAGSLWGSRRAFFIFVFR